MITILSTVVSILAFRLRRRAALELELIALRHQVTVLQRQHEGRLRLFSTDRLLWVWLYRVWPQVLHAMVLVKPATVVQWHRKGFRLYWRWRSRRLGRPNRYRKRYHRWGAWEDVTWSSLRWCRLLCLPRSWRVASGYTCGGSSSLMAARCIM